MYGQDMGQLEVLVIPSGHKKEESVWKYVGGSTCNCCNTYTYNVHVHVCTLTVHPCESVHLFSEQGYYWKEAQIEVSKRIQAIRIRATTGMSGPKGDMAIDDVKVSFRNTKLYTV